MGFRGFKLQVSQWFGGLESHCGHMHCAQRPAVADSHPPHPPQVGGWLPERHSKIQVPSAITLKMRCQGLRMGWAFHFTLASNYLPCAHLCPKSSTFSLMQNFTSKLQDISFTLREKAISSASGAKLCILGFRKNHTERNCCQTTSDGSIRQINNIKYTLHPTFHCGCANFHHCTQTPAWIMG